MFKYYLEELRRSIADRKFITNFSILIFGTAGAQLIGMVAIPVLTRIYSVENFGLQAIYVSIVSILSIVSTGRYELAILLPKEHKEGLSLVCLSLGLSAFFCVLLEGAIFLFTNDLVNVFHDEQFVYWLYYLPLSLWATVLYSICLKWLNRLGLYKQMSRMGMLISMFNFLVAYSYSYFLGANAMGLILYTFLGQLFVSIFVFCNLFTRKMFPVKVICWNDLWVQAKRYSDFPRYLILGHTLNTFSSQLPVFILQGIGGSVVVGYFSMVQKFLGMPVSLISTSVQNVFFREASIAYQAYKNCWAIYKKTFVLLFSLSVFPFLLVFVLAPDIFSLMLGEQWSLAGEYSRYLCPMFFLTFVSSPLSSMFNIAEKQQADLIFQVCRAILVYGCMQGAYLFYGSVEAVFIAYSMAFVFLHGINLVFTSKWARG